MRVRHQRSWHACVPAAGARIVPTASRSSAHLLPSVSCAAPAQGSEDELCTSAWLQMQCRASAHLHGTKVAPVGLADGPWCARSWPGRLQLSWSLQDVSPAIAGGLGEHHRPLPWCADATIATGVGGTCRQAARAEGRHQTLVSTLLPVVFGSVVSRLRLMTFRA